MSSNPRQPRSLAGVILTRLLGAVVVVWLTVTIAFVVVKMIPGDPVDVMLGPLASISAAERDEIRESLGLNQPLLAQYLEYLGRLLTVNFGDSYQLGQPVTEVIARAFPPTAALALVAMLFSAGFTGLGLLLARTRVLRSVLSVLHVFAVTLPVFWIGFLLLLVFSFALGWFPALDTSTPISLVLPAVAIAIPVSGILGQILWSGITDAEQQPFALSVRARGVSATAFQLRHAFRHGMRAVTPLAAQIFGGVLGGAILVEQVFSRPGLGSVALTAITNRDMPVILALIALSALLFAVLSIVADIALWMLDPRTRHTRRVTRVKSSDRVAGS